LLELVELFEDYNCAFNSLTESIDTDTPSGRMFLKIIGIFAEFERENLISRVTLGFERKAREGYTLATFGASYGYDLKKGDKIQVINPSEAKIVREIFEMYVKENMAMLAIAKNLMKRGIKTKKNGLKWNKSTIKSMLENPNYIGKVRYSTQDKDRYFEADGRHEPIISAEIFRLAHEKLRRNQINFKTNVPKEDKYFCGVLYCGKCGYKISTHQNYNLRKDGSKCVSCSYKCGGTVYDNCKMPNIAHRKMESLFNKYLENINSLEIRNAEIKNKETAEIKKQIPEYIEACEKKIKIQEKRKRQAMEQYISGNIDFEIYRQLSYMANGQYDTLMNEIARAKSEISAEKQVQITKNDIIIDLKENWQILNNKERFVFLQRFVKKIVIEAERISERKSTINIKSVKFV